MYHRGADAHAGAQPRLLELFKKLVGQPVHLRRDFLQHARVAVRPVDVFLAAFNVPDDYALRIDLFHPFDGLIGQVHQLLTHFLPAFLGIYVHAG